MDADPSRNAILDRRCARARRLCGALDLDFALHGDGAASTWAQLARSGDRAAIAGPGRGHDPDPGADWFLLAGDETAMPALVAIAAALPETATARLFLEVPTMRDAQDVASPADLDLRILPRRDAAAGHLMEAAGRATEALPGDGRVWVAREAGLVRRLRSHFLDDLALSRDHVVTPGYRKQGVASHPDHDYGD